MARARLIFLAICQEKTGISDMLRSRLRLQSATRGASGVKNIFFCVFSDTRQRTDVYVFLPPARPCGVIYDVHDQPHSTPETPRRRPPYASSVCLSTASGPSALGRCSPAVPLVLHRWYENATVVCYFVQNAPTPAAIPLSAD